MSDQFLLRLQQLWREYFEHHDKSGPAIHLLRSMKLTKFDNERSHFLYREKKTHYNNFKFLFEFTLSINNIALPLRFEFGNSFKHNAKIATDKLQPIHLTDSPVFEVSMNGYHVLFSLLSRQHITSLHMNVLFIVADYLEYSRAVLYQRRPGDTWTSHTTFVFDDKIEHFRNFLKLDIDHVSRQVFESMVSIIFAWSTSKQVTECRILHLQTLNAEFNSTDLETLRKMYQNK